MGVHGKSLENMENMEKMENINQMTESTLCLTQSTQFVNQMAQSTLLYGIYPMIKKIITYALGEHDLGSALDGRKCEM